MRLLFCAMRKPREYRSIRKFASSVSDSNGDRVCSARGRAFVSRAVQDRYVAPP
jgi:hypothetical protein